MNKRSRTLSTSAFMLACSSIALFSCQSETPTHTHAIYTMEASAPTCTREGNIEYQYCLYCGQCFLNDEEVERSAVILPIDHDNHTALTTYDEISPTCTETGVKAYWYCSDCQTYGIDGTEMNVRDDGQEAIDQALSIDVDPDAHSLIYVPQTDPTCVVDGLKAHMECQYCGALFDENGEEEITESDLTISATGEHDFSDGDHCAVCDGYKLYYDDEDEEKFGVIDGSNKYPFRACSIGPTHSTGSDRSEAVDALLSDRMTFSTQYGSGATITYDEDSWNVKHSSLVGSFTRFAVDDGRGDAYSGVFLLTFDVTIQEACEVSRLGIKVVEEVASGGVDPVEGGEFSKLIGTNSAEENDPDRVLTPQTTYRMQYLVETTSEDQMVQIFTHMGATTLSITNLHMLPLPEETGTGRVRAELLYFGEPVTQAASASVFGGGDFFDATDWESFSGDQRTAGELYDPEGVLTFKEDTASRFNLFYVVESSVGSFTHIGDNTSKTDPVDEIYGVEYEYTLDISSTGEFDMLLLGASGSSAPKSQSTSGIWLNFAEDGLITIYHGCVAGSTYQSWGEFSGSSLFEMNEMNEVKVKLTRVSASDLRISLDINGSEVDFSADSIINPQYFSTGDGDFYTSGVLSRTGFGQRIGFTPAEGSIVQITDIELPTDYFVAVTAEGGKVNGVDGQAIVPIDSEVVLTADDKEGYTFIGWSDGQQIISEERAYRFIATEAMYFTASYQTTQAERSYQIIDGKDFFDLENWEKTNGEGVMKDEETALRFTSTSNGRFDLFYVDQMEDGTWVHLADNGEDKTDKIPEIYGKSYSYDLKISATEAFDMLIIGPSAATTADKSTNGLWLSFSEDGDVTFNFGNALSSRRSWGEISCASAFSYGEDVINDVNLTLTRDDKYTLALTLEINGAEVNFTADSITNPDKFSADGGVMISDIFDSQGYGQRIGFFPSETSTVTVSDLLISIDGEEFHHE